MYRFPLYFPICTDSVDLSSANISSIGTPKTETSNKKCIFQVMWENRKIFLKCVDIYDILKIRRIVL